MATSLNKRLSSILVTVLVTLLVFGTLNISVAKAEAAPEAESVVESFLIAAQQGDTDKMASLCTGSSVENLTMQTSLMEKLCKSLYKMFTYKILSSNSDENSATVKISINSVDTQKLMNYVDRQVTDDETASIVAGKWLTDEEKENLTVKYFKKCLTESDNPTLASELYVKLAKDSDSGAWKIVATSDLRRIMLGVGHTMAEAKVIDFLEALKNSDNDSIASCFSGMPTVELTYKTTAGEEATKMALKKLDYEIGETDIGQSSASVTVKVKYIDTFEIWQSSQDEVLQKTLEAASNGEDVTDEMIAGIVYEYAQSRFAEDSAKTETVDITFELSADENGENWKIDKLDDYLLKDIIGYLD